MQVTEQARVSIEVRMKEAENQHRALEEKLQEVEKQKQDLEEQNLKTQASLEQQVFVFYTPLLDDLRSVWGLSFLLNIVQVKGNLTCRWTVLEVVSAVLRLTTRRHYSKWL